MSAQALGGWARVPVAHLNFAVQARGWKDSPEIGRRGAGTSNDAQEIFVGLSWCFHPAAVSDD